MKLEEFLKSQAERTETWLDRLVPADNVPPVALHKAMRYSLLGGGKRLRPALCIAASELFDPVEDEVMPVACALEMIHTYSLVHDDLPSMDNDDLRRGRPTCHRAFGEAMAILAGDALLTLAFEVLATATTDHGRRLRIVRTIARAAGGAAGMVGGQVLDLEAEGKTIGVDELDALHAAKTGALLTAAIVSGAIAAGADDTSSAILETYGRRVGLAFQIADDLLDVTASAEQLGKTPGKDAASLKATYPAIFGIEGSVERARWLVDAAIEALTPFGSRAELLREIACFAIERQK